MSAFQSDTHIISYCAVLRKPPWGIFFRKKFYRNAMPFYAAWHFCKEGSLKENGNCFRVSDGYYYNRFFREAEARWGDIFLISAWKKCKNILSFFVKIISPSGACGNIYFLLLYCSVRLCLKIKTPNSSPFSSVLRRPALSRRKYAVGHIVSYQNNV